MAAFWQSLEFLKNNDDENTATFLKKIVADGWRAKNNSGESFDFVDKSLEILFSSGKNNDFIWELFESSFEKSLAKLFKDKTASEMLNVYAFKIGAHRLDPEQFFKTFFVSGLYKKIHKENSGIFHEVFFYGDELKFSRNIAGWFAKKMDNLYMARLTVFDDDKQTFDLIKTRFYPNASDEEAWAHIKAYQKQYTDN